MGGERESDYRVPILSGLIFISCLAGGLILTLWLLDAKGAQPWFPILALVLLGFPWLFWSLICCYSINKRCLKGGGGDGGGSRATSKRITPEPNGNFGSSKGHVIVVDGAQSPVSSKRESEMPLNRSTAS